MKIRDRIVELRRVPARDLLPNPKNWRTHPKAQQEAMQGILAEVGYADALLARETNDGLQIIDGHLRAETTPDQEVPVLVLDLDEAEADKLLASLDPLAAMAGKDDDLLRDLLSGIETDSDALRSMFDDLVKPDPTTGLTEPDDVPELPDEPVTRPGDLWILGDHRLVCGDCTNAKDVRRLLDGAVPFIMVTDPPYGVSYDPTWRKDAGINQNDGRMGSVSNDDRADWTDAWALFLGDVSYVWHGALHASDVARSLTATGFQIRGQIIWKKPRFVLSRGAYHWGHEPAWYSVRKGRTARWCGDRSQSTVWDIALAGGEGDDAKGLGHGTQKPVECMRRPIVNHGGKDDHVYDPFCGSGTTIIACEQSKRHCYAMEIDPAYCDVIVKRWEEFTGKKASTA